MYLFKKLLAMEKEMSPKESLDLITHTIIGLRKNAKDNSFYFIAWGWIIILASVVHFVLLHYLLMQEKFDIISWATITNWVSFILAGIIIQFIHQKRNPDSRQQQSGSGKFLKSLWTASGSGIILLVIFISTYGINPTPFVLIIAAIATYTTGRMIRFKPLILGSIAFVLFGALALFIDNHYQLLINAAAILSGYIIPGYMLKKTKIIGHV
jgi:heme/copper-type cytochrome/quinol oxidase subunit 2